MRKVASFVHVSFLTFCFPNRVRKHVTWSWNEGQHYRQGREH